MVRRKITDACKALFEVPAKRKGQKLILFGRIETEPVACESSRGNSESPQFPLWIKVMSHDGKNGV